jgi:hypothetical protein
MRFKVAHLDVILRSNLSIFEMLSREVEIVCTLGERYQLKEGVQ